MKRRKFLKQSAGLVGAMIPGAAWAKSCPPVLTGSGASSPNSCVSAQDAEADWQQRINGPGVVWYHDFRNEAEVDAFRWTSRVGNDPTDSRIPGTCNWQRADGITGGACLETLRKAGTRDGSEWWRPFAAMTGESNGRGIDDPAANGTVTLRNFNSSNTNQTAGWNGSFYGNPIYHSGGQFDGHDYYIQARVKLHPNRPQEPNGGKLFYFTRTDRSLTSQELVTMSRYSNMQFAMYRSGSPGLWQDPPNEMQPNSEFSGIWTWPLDQWVTVLYHVRGGTNANGELPTDPGDPSGNPDTLVQVWVDWDGDRKVNDYIKIWDQPTVRLPFDGTGGHNAIICSGYMNGTSFSQDIWQRFDQLIFSKEFIPCPTV